MTWTRTRSWRSPRSAAYRSAGRHGPIRRTPRSPPPSTSWPTSTSSTAPSAPRARLPHRGEGRARGAALGRGDDPRGPRHRAPRASARRSRRRSARCSRPATIPAADKLRAKFPPGLLAVDAPPRPRAEARAPALRRARHRLAGRPARGRREQQHPRACAGFGPKVEEPCSRRSRAEGAGEPAARACCSLARCAIAERSSARCARTPAPERVELAGSARRRADSVKDLDIIADRADPAALVAALAELDVIESVSAAGRERRRARRTHTGMTVDLRVVEPDQFGNVLQHFTGSKAHNVALREAAVRRGLHVSEYGILDDATGETLRCADRGGGLRAARPRLDPARAARGPRRARGRGRRPAAASWSSRRTCAAICTATPPLRRAPRSSRWPRRRERAASSTSRSPTTPPPTASATTSRRTSSRADRAGARAQRAHRRHRAARSAREVNILTDGVARLRRRPAGRARLGRSRRVHTSFGMDEQR